jgi:hypothetical protein
MGRADVSVRGEWQRGMPSAGIARILNRQSFCAGLFVGIRNARGKQSGALNN